MKNMKREIIRSSVIGRKEENQDTVRYSTKWDIYLLADGLGGRHHKAGKRCSDFVVSQLFDEFKEIQQELRYEDLDSELVLDMIRISVKDVNEMVYHIGQNVSSRYRWGTTLEGGLIHDDTFYGVGVGDSKTIVANTLLSTVQKLTEEDVRDIEDVNSYSKVEKQVLISNRDPENYIGLYDQVKSEPYAYPIAPHDWIVMMSDGISDTVSDQEILNVIQKAPRSGIGKQLELITNTLFGSDKYSIRNQIYRVRENPEDVRRAYESLSEKGFDYNIENNIGDNASFIMIGGK